MEQVSTSKGGEKNQKIFSLLTFLFTLVLFAIILHPVVSFRDNMAALPIFLSYIIWLVFRIIYPRLADQRGIVRGILWGFGVFLFVEFAINAVYLYILDHQAFVASLYFCGGLFFLLDRLKRMFPPLKEKWPLPVVAFGLAALLFFGSFSSVVLLKIPCKSLNPEECETPPPNTLISQNVLKRET